MTKRMLIDAAHPEQTRVAIVDGNRVEEFDFESQSKRQLRGNIYLAKVTRVEASLQAAFVDFGGNRHGFLAFNEIHPDYYQIPVEDRQKLLEAEAAAEAEELEIEDTNDEEADDPEHDADTAEEAQIAVEAIKKREKRRRNNYRRYKIQEVIKHGQIMLVQVVKEERGTKGAALTSYMSLAGRYCVLMPNTAKGGGISRKISNAADRKRLKAITNDLDIASGMGLIIRTAGAKRNKTEIKRDYDYLTRLWGIIREKTLKSAAPTLVHEEGGLVRRAVRDLYGKDIEEVLVEGKDAYRDAKAFMKMLMPSHADRVKHYQEKYPVFLRYQVEDQLEAIHSPEVQLKSGGYLVIHQTEALVAIDVNSGRATRERNIEATALKTNLEAAEESCRQMRLRDLAGLIVIDFIDMEENKNNRAVEKRMKDALKRDRARVQAGRISMFGLFEMSRQRRRASVIEGTSQTCPTCNGFGVVRSVESSALQALQALESEGMRKRSAVVKLTAPSSVALYILNEKRSQLYEIENQSGMRVLIETNLDMHPPQHEIDVIEELTSAAKPKESAAEDRQKPNKRRGRKSKAETSINKTDEADKQVETANDEAPQKEENTEPKRRRRGKRGGRGRSKDSSQTDVSTQAEAGKVSDETIVQVEEETAKPETPENNKPKRVVRRRKKTNEADTTATEPSIKSETETGSKDAAVKETAGAKRKVRRPRRTKKTSPAAPSKPEAQQEETQQNEQINQASEKPKANTSTRPKRIIRKRRSSSQTSEAPKPEAAPEPKSTPKPHKKEEESKAQSQSVPAKKPKRTVRKRPLAKSPENAQSKPAETKADAKKSVRKPKVDTKKSDVSKPEVKSTNISKSEPIKEKAQTRKTRTRRKPAPKPRSSTKTEQNPQSALAAETTEAAKDEVKLPAKKKVKRSWRSRIFGGDKNS